MEEQFKKLEKYIPFIQKAGDDSVKNITDREKKTLKGIQKIIECRKDSAKGKLEKCEKFILKCMDKERSIAVLATPGTSLPPASSLSSPPINKTVTTVEILSSDEDDCAIVDDRNKDTSKAQPPKKEEKPQFDQEIKPKVELKIPEKLNITNMEILSLIDKLSEKEKLADEKEKLANEKEKLAAEKAKLAAENRLMKETPKVVDDGISLISSEESDSWNAETKEDEEIRRIRKEKKQKKKEQRKLEKLLALKEELNSKEKNIEKLKEKLKKGPGSSFDISEISKLKDDEKHRKDSKSNKENKSKHRSSDKRDFSKSRSPEEKREYSKSKYPEEKKNKKPSEKIEDVDYRRLPVDLPSSTSTNKKQDVIVEIPKYDEELSSTSSINEELFTRRTKREPLPAEEDSSIAQESSSEVPKDIRIFKQLKSLLQNDIGVDVEKFLEIMKTDKLEIKKEIKSKVSLIDNNQEKRFKHNSTELNSYNYEHLEQPYPPNFKNQNGLEEGPLPSMNRGDPRISQEINFNVNLNVPHQAMYGDSRDLRSHPTFNLNIRTPNGMYINSTTKQLKSLPLSFGSRRPTTSVQQPNHHKISPLLPQTPQTPQISPSPPLQQPPVRDPRLRRVQAVPSLSPTFLHSPEFSPSLNENLPRTIIPVHNPYVENGVPVPEIYQAAKPMPSPVFPSNNMNQDKKAPLTYGEYKKRKALEEQHKKAMEEFKMSQMEKDKKNNELTKLLNEVKDKSSTAIRQLNGNEPILTLSKDAVALSSSRSEIVQPPLPPTVIVKVTTESPVIEFVKPSHAGDLAEEVEDEMDEITRKNTLQNSNLKSNSTKIVLEEKIPTVAETCQETKNGPQDKSGKKETPKGSFRELIKLNQDIVNSFMPNDVLNGGYGLRRSRFAAKSEAGEGRIKTRRKSCSTVRMKDDSPPPEKKLKKRRQSMSVTKRDTKKAKLDDENAKNQTNENSNTKTITDDWQVEEKSPPKEALTEGVKPKINLVIRKRAQSLCSKIFSTSEIARPAFLKQLKNPLPEKSITTQESNLVEEQKEIVSAIPPPIRRINKEPLKKLIVKIPRLSQEKLTKLLAKNKTNDKNKAPESTKTNDDSNINQGQIATVKPTVKNTNRAYTFEDIFKEDTKCLICNAKSSDIVDHYVSSHFSECYISRLQFDQIINFETAELKPIEDSKGKLRVKYDCFVCKKTINNTLVGIIYHISSHTGEFSFRCEICDLEKPYKKDIQKHIEDSKNEKKKKGTKKKQEKPSCKESRAVHYYRYPDNDNELKCYYCKDCYFIQINKANILKHVKEHHNKVYNRENYVEEVLILKFKDEDNGKVTKTTGNVDKEGTVDMEIDETCDSATISVCSQVELPSCVPDFIKTEVLDLGEETTKAINDVEIDEAISSKEVPAATTSNVEPLPAPIEIIENPLDSSENPVPVKVENESDIIEFPDEENDLMPKGTIINSNIIRAFALFKCMDPGCLFATNLSDEFTKHIQNKGKLDTLFNCCYCSKAVKGQFSNILTEHIKNKHSVCRYQCNECNYRSFNLSNILVHKRSTHPLKGNLDVIDCLNALPADMARSLQIKDKKSMHLQICRCPVCPPPLMKVTTEEMQNHIEQSHPCVSRDKMPHNYYCLFCKYSCVEKYSMKEHMSIEHHINFLYTAKIVDTIYKRDGNKKRFTKITVVSLDDELKSFPKKSFLIWRANREDLNITADSFKAMNQDTLRYNTMMQVIPNYIPEEELQKCKYDNCNFKADNFETLLKHNADAHRSVLKCSYCPNINNFSSVPVIRDHFEKHTSKQIFICGGCNTFSSCRKLLTEHARMSHLSEDVVILEISRSGVKKEPTSNYYISLRDDRKTVSTFDKCFLCDQDIGENSIEHHLVNIHFFKLQFSCWKCENIVTNNLYDLNSHFDKVHCGIFKIVINLKSRFDLSEDSVKKENPESTEPAKSDFIETNVCNIEIKEEMIENDDDFIDIEDDEPPVPEKPPVQISLVPMSKIIDPKFLN